MLSKAAIFNIEREAQRIFKEYLPSNVEVELRRYAHFFKKPEIIQPVDDPTKQDVSNLANLILNLRRNRERVLVIYLRVKKAKNRLKHLERELLIIPQIKSRYSKLRNAEQRELFMYEHAKILRRAIERSKYLMDICDQVTAHLDGHAIALKDNMYALGRLIRNA
jgi:hypothetical protein